MVYGVGIIYPSSQLLTYPTYFLPPPHEDHEEFRKCANEDASLMTDKGHICKNLAPSKQAV